VSDPEAGAEKRDTSDEPYLTIVVPTYKEVESLPHLIDRVAATRAKLGRDVTLIIADDNSRDGSLELVQARGEPWVSMVVRTTDRGLSPSVLDGLGRAKSKFVVCMDADLSHPPEIIPAMLAKLEEGADFVVGSRYARGGTTSDDWGFLRWLNSRVATLLARPLTNIRDPMSGFFALRRSSFEAGTDFNPIGYKIGLELIVKCRCERVVEVPIHFEDRRFGESKLTFMQQILYLQHLRRLYIFKYGVWTQLLQFLVVGALGAAVNLAALTVLLKLGLPTRASVAIAIFVSMCFNFVLNRRFSFSASRAASWPHQFVRFVLASTVGAVLNYVVAIGALARFPALRPQIAALIGIAAGTTLNFVASRYLVFRAHHVRVGK
jgi:dolichol-phosphate mannosyltransferase